MKSKLSLLILLFAGTVIGQNDPCSLDNSIIKNPGFEQTDCKPTGLAQLRCALDWTQASSQGTTDFVRLTNTNTTPNIGIISAPPNGTEYFAGIQTFLARQGGSHHEYLGSCIPLENSSQYTFEAYVGAGEGPTKPYGNQPDFVGGFNGELVIMGLPNCNLPLSGRDCKEDQFPILARIDIVIPPGEWLPNKVHVTFNTKQKLEGIIIGLGCDIEERSYLLIDDIFLAKGNPCPEIISEELCCKQILYELKKLRKELETIKGDIGK